MTKKLKKRLYRILAGLAIYIVALVGSKTFIGSYPNVTLIAFLVAYFVSGGDVVKTAIKNITQGQMLDEHFLMMVATVGAFLVGEYPEGVAVMLFYQVGEWFQSYAVNQSRKSIKELMNIRPDYANVMRGEDMLTVSPDEVKVGEIICVKPGERIPLDGIIKKGESTLDTMALTGESMPREVRVESEVFSGCVNLSGVLEVEVTKAFSESTVSKILELVENASSRKSESENFISKFARYYTPAVVGLAIVLAVVPPLFVGNWYVWIYRALSFLVVSCPCALVISIPLSFFGGLGGASKAGILIKGSNYLEAMAKAEIVVMDKTGTLTKGNFAVSQIALAKGEEIIRSGLDNMTQEQQELLELTAYAESASNHPISKSLLSAYGKEIERNRIGKQEEMAGFGVCASIDGKNVLVGNHRHMQNNGIECEAAKEIGTIVYVACDGVYKGYIIISDEIKPDAKAAVEGLAKAGVKEVVMLTGDRKETANQVAAALNIKTVYSELLPANKVERMEELLQKKSANAKLVFVGDGMNDAPVLARSDIGIAMGGMGSDAAIEAADIVIMTDEPSKIVRAMQISRKTLAIVRQNIVFAIGVKLLILALAACGIASMWAAVFGDVGVAVIAILNAMRAMKS